jgi:hypothetical protein
MHVTAVILERSLTLDDESLSQVQQNLLEEFPERTAPRCAQRQIKLAFFMLQERRIMKVLKDWGNMMWSTSSNTSKDHEWATAFSVFLMMILVTDKILGAAYYFCEGNIVHGRNEANSERRQFLKLVELTQKELFERCKEIFHWKFKTRKGGKEACNPIRDGIEAFHSKSKSAPVDSHVRSLVSDLQAVVEEFGKVDPDCFRGLVADMRQIKKYDRINPTRTQTRSQNTRMPDVWPAYFWMTFWAVEEI